MSHDTRRLIPVQDLAAERQRAADRQVDIALERASSAGRYDASLFTEQQIETGVRRMQETARASRNLLSHYGLL